MYFTMFNISKPNAPTQIYYFFAFAIYFNILFFKRVPCYDVDSVGKRDGVLRHDTFSSNAGHVPVGRVLCIPAPSNFYEGEWPTFFTRSTIFFDNKIKVV